jgi:hypothetical protein
MRLGLQVSVTGQDGVSSAAELPTSEKLEMGGLARWFCVGYDLVAVLTISRGSSAERVRLPCFTNMF